MRRLWRRLTGGCLTLIVLVILLLAGALFLNIAIATPAGLQPYFPKPAGYRYTNVLPQALRLTADMAERVGLGQVYGSLFGTGGEILACYQQAGAADLYLYVRNDFTQSGLVAVVDQNLILQNIQQCVQSNLRAPERCLKVGSITQGGSTRHYLYAAFGQELCTAFQTHFAAFN